MRGFLIVLIALLVSPAAVAQVDVQLVRTEEGCSFWIDNLEENLTGSWSGPCVEGLAHGEGVLVMDQLREEGREPVFTYEGPMRAGYINGIGVMVWANGDRYEGQHIDGLRSGQGILTGANKRRYEGEWKDDKFHGIGTYVSEWGRNEIEGKWYEGVLVIGICTTPGGLRKICKYSAKDGGIIFD